MYWMTHNTDSRVQLDIWESLLNLAGWNWKTLSTAYRESETKCASPRDMPQYFHYDAAVHGGKRYIFLTYQPELQPYQRHYKQSERRTGYVVFGQSRAILSLKDSHNLSHE
jgi:hypothetical protein